MLEDVAMKSIGKYAKTKTNNVLFGVGTPNLIEASESLLFSFALTNKKYLDEQTVKNIITRIADRHL